MHLLTATESKIQPIGSLGFAIMINEHCSSRIVGDYLGVDAPAAARARIVDLE